MALNIAHRGARSLAPENTMAAARKALEAGSDLWETDLAVTRDGELILFHDDSLARTTDVEIRFPGRPPGPFSDYTLEEIRSLDAGSWFAQTDPYGQIAAGAVTPAELEAFRGEKVPTLREALEFTRESGWLMNLELKRQPPAHRTFPVVDRVLSLIDELGLGPEHVLLSSGEHHWLKEIQRRRPEFTVQALIGLSKDEPLEWSGMKFKTYNVRVTLTSEDEVRRLVSAGHEVNLYVVNAIEDMRRYIDAGAAGLITDFPQLLKGLDRNGR